LAPLTPADRARLLAAARPRTFRRNEIVFNEGDRGETLHLVRKGRLGVRISTSSGESVTLSVLSPGDAFGELALVSRPPHHYRTATVTAFESSETLALSGTSFTALCREHPSVERLVVSLLAERVDQLSRRLLEALYIGVEGRVFRRLMELAEIYGNGQAGTIIPLTQDDLAGLAGASRPTVNQVLARLGDQGIVEVGRGRIQILQPAGLRRLAAG
jgi:CRP/FNR family transcriptional regulator, cyclic AMP receptor protein